MTVAMQPPASGCENCAAPVRSRKAGGWICWQCQRRLDQAQGDDPSPVGEYPLGHDPLG